MRIWTLGCRIRDAILVRIWAALGSAVLRGAGIEGGLKTRFYGLPIITRAPNSSIEIGSRVVLCSHSRFTALGVSRPVILRTLRTGARLRIGSDVGLSGAVICCALSVDIGDGCLFGADVQITDTDFHAVHSTNRRYENNESLIDCRPVAIEDNVFLGAGVKVLKGVRIGQGSVIGAGSIVSKDVPAGVIAAGVPARIIGSIC